MKIQRVWLHLDDVEVPGLPLNHDAVKRAIYLGYGKASIYAMLHWNGPLSLEELTALSNDMGYNDQNLELIYAGSLDSSSCDGVTISCMKLAARVENLEGDPICMVFTDGSSKLIRNSFSSEDVPIFRGPAQAASVLDELRQSTAAAVIAYYINRRFELVFLSDPCALPFQIRSD